jgi:hypothetical protein
MRVRIILAIAPNSRGFGFVVFLTRKRIADWGIKEARHNKNAGCINHSAFLIDRYRPSAIILEDWRHQTCRRSERVRALLEAIGQLAIGRGITVYRYSRRQLREVFAGSGKSKDAIAIAVSQMVPALLPWLPRKRRIWESEQHSMAIFDAASLVLTHYAHPTRPSEG